MSVPEGSPGVYAVGDLNTASRFDLVEYETLQSSGLNVLYAPDAGRTGSLDCYPLIDSELHGELSDQLKLAELSRVTTLISGEFYAPHDLSILRRRVGAFVEWDRERSPEMVYEDIRSLVKDFNNNTDPRDKARLLPEPTKKWRKGKYVELYGNLMKMESDDLFAEVAQCAAAIILANSVAQLYVQHEFGSGRCVGMMGPIVGLAIEGGYLTPREQIKNVLPVVSRRDNSMAVMQRPGKGLYAKLVERT